MTTRATVKLYHLLEGPGPAEIIGSPEDPEGSGVKASAKAIHPTE